MNETKCNDCPKFKTHTNGWNYCGGNSCEIDVRNKTIDEYKNKLWEDIETRYKNDIKILGYLSAENLLRDVHNAICYFAEQLKEQK